MTDHPGQYNDEEKRLRKAQHRVRNDFQTLYNLLLIAEKRLGLTALPIDEFARWIASIGAAHDALPFWKDGHPRMRHLIAALRNRIDVGEISIVEDDDVNVPEASAVAVALAISGVFDWYGRFTTASHPTVCRLSADNSSIVIVISRQSPARQSNGWPPFSVAVALEALRGTCEQQYENGLLRTILILPCR